MSVEQARRNLTQIHKEIADLEKRLATEVRNEADKTKRIYDINKSITNNTSLSMIQSKSRQIQSLQNDLVSILNKKSDLNSKIADKKNRLSTATTNLQREEQLETKKTEKKHTDVLRIYEQRISSLTKQLAKNNITQSTQSNNHLYSEINNEKYDVFISHASEDKEDFVDEFYETLTELGVKVWYDSLNIAWGDSLRSKIDNGLKNSKFGIVVISPAFISKGWTQYELDGLFQIEMTNGKTVLPIWHKITKNEVQEFSATLAGRKAMSTGFMTPTEIAHELRKILELTN